MLPKILSWCGQHDYHPIQAYNDVKLETNIEWLLNYSNVLNNNLRNRAPRSCQ